MVAPFPVVKLAALLMKQISKPLANFVKKRAINNAFFRNYVCIPPAQFYNWCDVRMKMYLSNIIRTNDSVPIPKLNEQAAIELGANLLGEIVIIGVASSILLWEYNRQQNKEEMKEQKEEDFVHQLDQRVTDLAFLTEELDTKIRELTRLVHSTPAIMANSTKLEEEGAISKAVKEAKIKLKSSS